MGYVTVTESEYVGEVSKTTSITFECFEDFLAYDEKTRNVVKGPLTKLEVGKEYRVIDEIEGHDFNIGDIIRVIRHDKEDTLLPYEAVSVDDPEKGFWVTVKEVEEV